MAERGRDGVDADAGWSTATPRRRRCGCRARAPSCGFDVAEPTRRAPTMPAEDDDAADAEDWADDDESDVRWERPPAPLPPGSRRVRPRGRRADRPGALRVPAAGGAGAAGGARSRTGVAAGVALPAGLVGARGGRPRARRLPGLPPPPGADGGGDPRPPGRPDGRHPPSAGRGRPRAGRVGRTRPRRHPAAGLRARPRGRRGRASGLVEDATPGSTDDDDAARPTSASPRTLPARGAARSSRTSEPALPRLRPTPPPPLPAGNALVVDEDDELDLDDGAAPGYRRAVGQ